MKESLKDSLWAFLRNEHDLILTDSEVFDIIDILEKYKKMRTKTTSKILSETPESVKQKVRETADELVMKQTAVEWYEKEINFLFEKYESKEISQLDFITMKHNLFYPAIEMEKQQIIDARVNGVAEGIDIGDKAVFVNISKNHEQYYNEQFKKK